MHRCNICDDKAREEDLNLKFNMYNIYFCLTCMDLITDLVVIRNIDLVKEKIKEKENE